MDKPITFGSLFAGIGGIDLGFERAGMNCKWQVEIDDYANKVLAKHWPSVQRCRDVRTFPPKPKSPWLGDGWRKRWGIDVITAGFPCQDISYAGKGAGLAGERSGLFYEVCRIVRTLGPRVVVLENVAALLTRGMGEVLGSLASLGYDAEWHCMPAAAVGAPHIRDRVFVLGYSTKLLSDGSNDNQRSDSKIVGSLPKPRNANSKDNAPHADCPRFANDQGQRSAARSSGWDQPISDNWWNTEPDVGRVANGVPNRVDRLRGIGNAVVPQVSEFIGRRIVDAMQTAYVGIHE